MKKTKNQFEQKILKQLKKTKLPVEYEAERIPYVLAGHYIPDYVITTLTGKVYIEAKGHFRPEAKRKMAAVKRQHPEKDIRIVFYPGSKKKITQYERWAIKNGFRFAWGEIPKDWFNGF